MRFFCFLLISIPLLLISCHTKTENKIDIDKNLTIEQTVESILSEEYSQSIGLDEKGRQLLHDFYKQRNFKPLWSNKKELNEIGSELKKLLKTPLQFGLSDKRFELKWETHPIVDEIIIVNGLTQSYNDLRYGMLDSSFNSLKSNNYIDLISMDTLLDFSNKNYVKKIISWGPNDSIYQILANGLFEFVQQNPINEEKVEIKTIKEDTLAAISGTKKQLIAKKYLDSALENDSTEFVKALKQFQSEHWINPNGIIGTNTVNALTETNLEKAQRIAWAMEKQRRKLNYPKRHININIPEYMLRMYNEDTLCSEHRIIVGKFENQTPELKSNLHSIVVYPYWNVPYSIASKEILPAAKRNSNYFEKNDMILLQKGDTINPTSVNWKKIKENSFPYRVQQKPGYKNSLGILKFDFHNKYDVYFHDTPSKGLFNTVSRSYSHGCMRTEKPIDLAKVILELDENFITKDTLDTLIAHTGINYKIKLKKQIPISIEYNSVIVKNQSIVILRDIYHRDEKFIKIMFEKS